MAGVAVLPAHASGELVVPPVNLDLMLCLPPLPLPAELLQCPQQSQAPAATPPAPEPEPTAKPAPKRFDPRRIIVDLKGRPTQETIDKLWRRAGVSPVRTLKKVGLYVVQAPADNRDEALSTLGASRYVKGVDRELVVDGLDTTPTDPDWSDQWGLRRAGFPFAWDVTRGSRNVVVAVLDTGVDASHPDLKGALVPGRDIVNGDADPKDDNGHGTAVAGVVAARANNAAGVAGACWRCSVMPVKVLGSDGTGTTSNVAAGIIWAVDHGARVINLSLGAPGTTQALSDAVSYALARDVVLVAAAGNSSTDEPFYPAAAPNVIGVAATNESDRLYSWSNRGSWVHVTAPGCNSAPWLRNDYVGFCGTSAAAPLVAGLAGLIRSAAPQASAAETATLIVGSVDGVAAGIGGGRINAGAALARVTPARTTTRRTAAYKGRLDRRHRSRSVKQTVGAGQLRATLKFRPKRRLSLVVSQPGTGATRVSGKSPLRLSRSVDAGPVTVVVGGRGKRARYVLKLSAVAPGV
ncbi:MAG TPA: S8 family serine peptidase [Gaiellaceae bacterium]